MSKATPSDRFDTTSGAASWLGKRGAETRWGPPRRHAIGDLTPQQRREVAALIETMRAHNKEARTK